MTGYKDKEMFRHGNYCHRSKSSDGFNAFVWTTKEKNSHPAKAYTGFQFHENLKWVIVEDVAKYQLEGKFNELAERWKTETGVFSTTFHKVANDNYLDIIALGKPVIPLILRDIQNGGTAHWHSALKALTGSNPVSSDELSKNKMIREAWLRWGKENKKI